MPQSNAAKIISNSLKSGKVFHSYIFANENGFSGNAEYLIKELLSTSSPVDQHPSIVRVKSVNGVIRKDDVLVAAKSLQMTSTHDGNRILLIENVENGNKSSLNSLLKFIEDPMKNVYIIMTTKNVNKVLKTIVSRSQVLWDAIDDNSPLLEKLGAENIDPQWLKYYSSLNISVEEVMELYNGQFHITLKLLIKDLSKALDNKAYIHGPIGKVITKDNYKYIIQALDLFYNDIWKLQSGIPIIFENVTSIVNSYVAASFKYDSALRSIRNFDASLSTNVNFTLAKSNMLINLEASYE